MEHDWKIEYEYTFKQAGDETDRATLPGGFGYSYSGEIIPYYYKVVIFDRDCNSQYGPALVEMRPLQGDGEPDTRFTDEQDWKLRRVKAGEYSPTGWLITESSFLAEFIID